MFVSTGLFLTAVTGIPEPSFGVSRTLAVCLLDLLSPGISEMTALNIKTHEVSTDGDCFNHVVSAVLGTHYPFG